MKWYFFLGGSQVQSKYVGLKIHSTIHQKFLWIWNMWVCRNPWLKSFWTIKTVKVSLLKKLELGIVSKSSEDSDIKNYSQCSCSASDRTLELQLALDFHPWLTILYWLCHYILTSESITIPSTQCQLEMIKICKRTL